MLGMIIGIWIGNLLYWGVCHGDYERAVGTSVIASVIFGIIWLVLQVTQP